MPSPFDQAFSCKITDGLDKLRAVTPGIPWPIVSGGDQMELRDIFKLRGISDYFDGGIFGSPASKDLIITRELQLGSIETPALFWAIASSTASCC